MAIDKKHYTGAESEGGITSSYATDDGVKLKVPYSFMGSIYDEAERNAALAKYSTSFDTAQRYVWELAKVYDYETGLLSTDPQSGKKFLADIVATRSLGQEGVTIDSSTTDGGLWDVVTRMKANWDVLKGHAHGYLGGDAGYRVAAGLGRQS